MQKLRFSVVAVAVWLVVGGPSLGAAPAATTTAHDAIASAVARRLGGGAVVTVSKLETSLAGEPGLEALPAPDARVGEPARFILTAGGVRRGMAVATVTAFAACPRAARVIARDEA